MNLDDALDSLADLVADAKAALADEHEGRLRSTVNQIVGEAVAVAARVATW